MTADGPLRVGVLADPSLREWQARSLERADAAADVELSLVLVDEAAMTDEDRAIVTAAATDGIGLGRETLSLLRATFARERAWALVLAERELGERFGENRPLSARRAVSDVRCLEDVDTRRVTPERDGSWNELPTEAVRAVRTRCDVVVRYGFGLLRGAVLDAPEHGVLSFHPADVRRYRGLGAPMAYLDGRETIGVTLQRLTEEIDAGEIVAESRVRVEDGDTLWDVYERIYDRQVDLLLEGLRAVRDPAADPTVPDELGPYYSMDRRRRPGFAVRTLARNLRSRLA